MSWWLQEDDSMIVVMIIWGHSASASDDHFDQNDYFDQNDHVDQNHHYNLKEYPDQTKSRQSLDETTFPRDHHDW